MTSFDQLILLDRDGVINEDRKNSILQISELEFIPGSLRAIQILKRMNYIVLVITNQACVGRGEISLEMLGLIHERLREEVRSSGGEIDDFFIC